MTRAITKKLAAATLGLLALAPMAQARDRDRDVDFDFRSDRGRFGLCVDIFGGRDRSVCPTPVVERCQRIWVDPVYRTECQRVWCEAVYRTVCDRVWCEPVTKDVCERVWIEPVYEIR